MKGLLLGSRGGTHIGGSLLRAEKKLNVQFSFEDYAAAYRGASLARKIVYRFWDKRPLAMRAFNQRVMQVCQTITPDFLLATGMAPLNAKTLKGIGGMGIKRLNYLTDDPWNPAHRSRWFFETLPHYDVIFSVRSANIENLRALGCPRVVYLPFGYDPDLFYSEHPTEEQTKEYESDVLFVGGADKDRLPYIKALIQAGYNIRLYGGYWKRFRETKKYTLGSADPQTIRLATACTKIALCLVRRANRDDNCMRSFEIPAMGACMLAEDTQGHRNIFGEENRAVFYFSTIAEMVRKAQYLIAQPQDRKRLAFTAHQIITQGGHTYQDRLERIMEICKEL